MEEFINYAHRGASEYYPENTFLAFYAGLAMGANGIETDVQMSRDRIPVLFHDRTLERMTGKPGSIGEYTYDELMAIEASKGRYRDKITGLEDFLRHFSFQPLRFAIELKGADAEEAVAENICRYKIEKKTVVTSFEWEYLKKFREILPQVQIGFLGKKRDNTGTHGGTSAARSRGAVSQSGQLHKRRCTALAWDGTPRTCLGCQGRGADASVL